MLKPNKHCASHQFSANRFCHVAARDDPTHTCLLRFGVLQSVCSGSWVSPLCKQSMQLVGVFAGTCTATLVLSPSTGYQSCGEVTQPDTIFQS
jgi:hypothetical protein